MSEFKQLFADTACYTATVPGYVGGCMAFGWGTDDTDLRQVPLAQLEQHYATASLETQYYTPAVHQAAFALPGFIAELIR